MLVKAERMTKQAAHLPSLAFQAIHLARSILHLVICMIESRDLSFSRMCAQVADLGRHV